MARLLNNLTIETAGTEEDAAEDLEAALWMEVKEYGRSKGKEGGDGNPRSLGAL